MAQRRERGMSPRQVIYLTVRFSAARAVCRRQPASEQPPRRRARSYPNPCLASGGSAPGLWRRQATRCSELTVLPSPPTSRGRASEHQPRRQHPARRAADWLVRATRVHLPQADPPRSALRGPGLYVTSGARARRRRGTRTLAGRAGARGEGGAGEGGVSARRRGCRPAGGVR